MFEFLDKIFCFFEFDFFSYIEIFCCILYCDYVVSVESDCDVVIEFSIEFKSFCFFGEINELDYFLVL